MKIISRLLSQIRKISLSGLVRTSIYLVVFLIPLFVVASNQLALEYNKALLFYFLVAFGLFFCLLDAFFRRQIKFTFNTVDALLILMVIVYAISSFVSRDSYNSFLGLDLKITFSFVTLFSLTLFYFLVRTYIKTPGQMKVIGGLIGSSVGLLLLYEIVRFFAPFGTIEIYTASFDQFNLVIFLAVATSGVLYLVGNKRKSKIASSILFVVSLLFMFALDNQIGLLSVIFFFFGFIFISTFKSKLFTNKFIGGITVIMFVITLGLILPVREWLNMSPVVDLKLPMVFNWEIVKGVLSNNLLFGVGPQNFDQAFYLFKPASYNLSVFWQVGFVKASSFFFEILVGGGLLGVLAVYLPFVYVLFQGIRVIKRTKVEETISSVKSYVLFQSILVLLFVFFVISFIVNFELYLLIILFVLMAFASTLFIQATEVQMAMKNTIANIFLYIGLLLLIIPSYYIFNGKLSNTYIYTNRTINSIEDVRQQQDAVRRAISVVPQQASNYINLSNLKLAEYILQVNSDAEFDAIALKNEILQNYKKTMQNAGSNYQNYINLRASMLLFGKVFDRQEVNVLQIHEKLKELDPNNAELYYLEANDSLNALLAGSLESVSDTTVRQQVDEQIRASIKTQFEKAIELKRDYVLAYKGFGDYYNDIVNDYTQAETQYTKALVLDPVSKEILIPLLGVLSQNGKYEESLAITDRYLQDNNEDIDLLTRKIDLLTSLGREDEAKEVETLVESLNTDDSVGIDNGE